MREIHTDEIKKAVEELFVAAHYNLPRDVYERIRACPGWHAMPK